VSNLGYADVFRGGATSFTIVDGGGTEYVLSAGTANDTFVNSGGYEVASRRGIAIGTTVSSGGTEAVYLGGSARDTTISIGGMIDVASLTYVSTGGSTSVTSTGLLTVSMGGESYSQQLAGDYAQVSFHLGKDSGTGTLITAEAPCYRGGTCILTDRGEVAVEALRRGDLVQTVLGGMASPITWIGRREVDCARHPQPRKVWPVRIATGAFGPGRPHTELLLSPDHAVYVNDVLIPVRYLINGSTIVQVPVERVTYYHLELPQHDVVLAEGLPAESFLDVKDGSNYANRPGPVRLYPDYAPKIWEAFGCTRLVVTGPELVAARALVADFAADRDAA
jgi:autotransporter passenger strand-loop-strand repeat protein